MNFSFIPSLVSNDICLSGLKNIYTQKKITYQKRIIIIPFEVSCIKPIVDNLILNYL
jgi:hypothetical protein